MWSKDPKELEVYQDQYHLAKKKLQKIPRGKQFDCIFCRRVMKWIDVFSTSDQFSSLSNQKLEGIEQLMNQFHRIKQDLKSKKHDLLDYQNNKFDRDFVELNVQIADLESSLHQIYFQPQIP